MFVTVIYVLMNVDCGQLWAQFFIYATLHWIHALSKNHHNIDGMKFSCIDSVRRSVHIIMFKDSGVLQITE